jgi:pimeloyl-ACP methyl ester carboxylesterase
VRRAAVFVGACVLGGAAIVASLAVFTALQTRRIKRLVPPEGRFTEVAGHRIHYRDEGTGPNLVFIHGLAGQMRNFSHSLLDLLTPHFRVVLIDRPGCGHSLVAPGTHPGLREQAAIIAEVIQKLELNRPLLVGHSFGGALALALALDHPHSISGVALITPLTQIMDCVPKPFRLLEIKSPLVRYLLSRILLIPMATLFGKKSVELLFYPHAAPEDFGVKGGGLLTVLAQNYDAASNDLRGANRELRKLITRYASIQVPVSILFSRGDAILSPQLHGEQFVGIVPGARLDFIEGGHMIPVTAPQATAEWIRTVFTNLSRPEPT